MAFGLATRTALGSLTLGLALLVGTGAAAASPVGSLVVVESPVELRAGASGSFAAAQVDQDVSVGDTLRTGRGGLAKLLLEDDASITVDEETELVIDRYALGGGEPSQVRLLSGHVRTKVGETFGGDLRLQMTTPTAVIGVKGTHWLTWHRVVTETTWVCVVSGVVSAAAAGSAGATALELTAGQCARVRKSKPPERAPLPGSLEPVRDVRTPVELSLPAAAAPGIDRPLGVDDPDRDILTADDSPQGLDRPDLPQPQEPDTPDVPDDPGSPPPAGNPFGGPPVSGPIP